MKYLLIIVITALYSFNVYTQNKAVYVIFTSYNKDTIGEGVDKSFCKPNPNNNYPSIYYEIQSVRNDYLYPFIHASTKNIRKDVTNPIIMSLPQSYLIKYQSQLIDWDVIGPTLNYLQVYLIIKEWENADKIYFIDRNDFYESESMPLMKVIEVSR